MPEGVVTLCCGGPDIGELMAKDTRVIYFYSGFNLLGEIAVFHWINQNRKDSSIPCEQQIWKMHFGTRWKQCLYYNGGRESGLGHKRVSVRGSGNLWLKMHFSQKNADLRINL